MAKQAGIIKLKGTIGDIAFYKSGDGHMARFKGGIDKSVSLPILLFNVPEKMGRNLDAPAKAVNYCVAPCSCSYNRLRMLRW